MARCNLANLCGNLPKKNIKRMRNSPVQAPFVIVQIRGGDEGQNAVAVAGISGNTTGISVGNKSFPAVVKSLQIGSSNGTGCDIEIVDQEAGDFAEIFKKLSRGGSIADFRVSIRWGWIDTDCSGALPDFHDSGAGNPLVEDTASAENHFLLLNMSVNYTMGGTVKYTLNCTDWVQSLYDSSSRRVFPNMSLKDAIKQLLSNNNLQVEFIKFDGAGTQGQFKFERKADGSITHETDGPVTTWHTNNRNVLDTIYNWMLPYVAGEGRDGKGLRVFYEPTSQPPKLICMVSTQPTCESLLANRFTVGTYVVNGGDCSPVISFQPIIKYNGITAFSTGGGAPGNAPGTAPMQGPSPCIANPGDLPNLYNRADPGQLRVGLAVSPTLTRWEILTRMNNAVPLNMKGVMLHVMANNYTAPIQADLRVVGDPTFSRPFLFVGRYVTLLVINPYQITKGCEWSNKSALANQVENCNEVLTHTEWMIDGVFHDIKNGSYTTTLRLRLAAPGQEVRLTAPPGGGR